MIFNGSDQLLRKGSLIGTGFADLFEKTGLLHQFRRTWLDNALMNKLLPRISNLELHGRGAVQDASELVESHRFGFDTGREVVYVPATWLSQGYQGLIAWVSDLIGQQFWDTRSPPQLDEMEGMVLIDELDLYLHPTWQVSLVRALKKVFPRLQFIVTTHSPMLLPGFERDEILMLRLDTDGNVDAKPAEYSPMLMTGSEIYRTFFGVEGLYPAEAGTKLQRYGFISGNPRLSSEEEYEMERLHGELAALGVEPGLGAGPEGGFMIKITRCLEPLPLAKVREDELQRVRGIRAITFPRVMKWAPLPSRQGPALADAALQMLLLRTQVPSPFSRCRALPAEGAG